MDPRPTPTDKPVPWGFLGMLALVVMVEGTIRLNRTLFTEYNALSWAFTREHLAAGAVGAEILCLGDSRMKYAVIPQAVAAATGRHTYNLAITAGRPATSYFLLRDALEAGARPRAIVVDFDDKLLADEPLSPDAPPPWAELLGRRDAVELERELGVSEFATRIALEQILASLKNRRELRAMIARIVRGKGPGSRRAREAAWRNWTVNGGAQVNTKRHYEGPPAPTRPEGHVEGTWTPDSRNVVYVERLLQLAQDRAIPVYWLLTPRCPTVQLWRDWYGEDPRYERFAASILARFPNVVIIDARHSGYDTSVFVDTVHLDRDGAATLSHDLAVAIESISSMEQKPRWALLPAFRHVPANVALEDFDESRAALEHGAAAPLTPALPHKGGGSKNMFPPPLWGRAGEGRAPAHAATGGRPAGELATPLSRATTLSR